MDFSKNDLSPFIHFKTSRSGGSGGQNVNKVSTKVELLFDFSESTLFTKDEKEIISKKLHSRIQSDGLIQVISQESRSQLVNKENALNKLFYLLEYALKVQKPRKSTKPNKNSIQKRLNSKRKQALKKLNRAKNWE